MPRLPVGALGQSTDDETETSEQVRQRVTRSRQLQLARSGRPNSQLQGRALEQACALAPDGRQLLERAMEQLRLSARAYHRILRLARTIADLAESDPILPGHLGEAIGYRRLDRTA